MDSFQSDGVCEHYTHSMHTSDARTRDFSRLAQDLSHRVRFHVSLTKTVIPHIKHSMSHALSLLFPSQLNTTSLSTCTPIRPSSCLSTGPLMMSSSRGDIPCADPSNVSCGPMAETTSPTETPSRFVKVKYQNIMIHLETLITYLRTRDCSACERHFSSSKTTKL